MRNFHPHEVVGRVSDTQLQVGDNLNGNCKCLISNLRNIRNFYPLEVASDSGV